MDSRIPDGQSWGAAGVSSCRHATLRPHESLCKASVRTLVAPIMAAFLSGKTWWPLFPLLLLLVVTALSAAVVLAVKGKVARADVGIQSSALVCYLLTAVVAMASEGDALSPHLHHVPSLLTQAILLAQFVRIWRNDHMRALRALNLIAWGGIL